MSEAERWPIDFDAVRKGDILNRARLAEIIGERPGTYTYQYKLAEFQDRLTAELWDRGKPYTVIHERGCLRVLNDEEVAAYAAKRRKRMVRGIKKALRHVIAADPNNMTNEERLKREREILVSSTYLGHIREARKELRPIDHRRMTPGLPTSE